MDQTNTQTHLLPNRRAKHELAEMRENARDGIRHLRKVITHAELAMKTMQDLMDSIGKCETAIDTTGTANQGIVDDLDSQLDAAVAASDTTAAVDAVDALTVKASQTVTSTHSPAPAPKA